MAYITYLQKKLCGRCETESTDEDEGGFCEECWDENETYCEVCNTYFFPYDELCDHLFYDCQTGCFFGSGAYGDLDSEVCKAIKDLFFQLPKLFIIKTLKQLALNEFNFYRFRAEISTFNKKIYNIIDQCAHDNNLSDELYSNPQERLLMLAALWLETLDGEKTKPENRKTIRWIMDKNELR
jgi:predicted amidophosphoribosyltransferase